MPAFEDDYKAIEAARGKLSSLTETAGKQDAASATFRDDVMARVRQARADRGMTTLQNDLGQATTRLATGRAQIRERMGTGVNPLTVDSVTAAERGQALGTLATIANIMQDREGTIEDIIGAGKNKLLAAATVTKSQADAAAQELQGLLQLVQIKQQEAQREIDNTLKREQFDEEKSQFKQRMELDYAQLAKSGGGGSEKVYPFEEPYISSGLAGKPISDVGNKVAAATKAQLDEEARVGKKPSGAIIKETEKQGYKYDPITNKFVKNPGVLKGAWDFFFGGGGG